MKYDKRIIAPLILMIVGILLIILVFAIKRYYLLSIISIMLFYFSSRMLDKVISKKAQTIVGIVGTVILIGLLIFRFALGMGISPFYIIILGGTLISILLVLLKRPPNE